MSDRIEKLCIEKGMRMTEQRRVIARVLSEADDHPDVEELHRRAHAIDPHISIATVYRTVRLLEEAGIITRHDFRDGRSRYEELPTEHHDHLINMKTGEVVEFSDPEIEALQEAIAQRLGFRPQIWSPLAAGRLLSAEGERPAAIRAALDLIAAGHGLAGPGEAALAWIARHPTLPVPVIGSGKRERIDAALKALDVDLDRQDWYGVLEAATGAPVR